jgi:hypothetical protein
MSRLTLLGSVISAHGHKEVIRDVVSEECDTLDELNLSALSEVRA